MHYWQSINREYIQHLEMSVGHRQSSTAKDLQSISMGSLKIMFISSLKMCIYDNGFGQFRCMT